MSGAYDAGPCVTAYTAALRAWEAAGARVSEAGTAAVKEALAPFFRENPVLRAVTWAPSAEYDDQGGTYTSLCVRIDTADDETPLHYDGEEVGDDDLEQVLHDLLWGTFREEDLVALVDENSGVARLTREDVLASAAAS